MHDHGRKFQAKYPYHFEDFVSDHPESTQYVAYNFAKRQATLMHQGMSEKRSFERVEKEFLAEMDAINSRLFVKAEDKEKSLDKKLADKDKTAYQYMNVGLVMGVSGSSFLFLVFLWFSPIQCSRTHWRRI